MKRATSTFASVFSRLVLWLDRFEGCGTTVERNWEGGVAGNETEGKKSQRVYFSTGRKRDTLGRRVFFVIAKVGFFFTTFNEPMRMESSFSRYSESDFADSHERRSARIVSRSIVLCRAILVRVVR